MDICLQMDTEMKRSGIEVTGFEGLIRDLNFLYDVLKVQGIMIHHDKQDTSDIPR